MRRFITTEAKRRAIDKAWVKLLREVVKHPNEWDIRCIATWRRDVRCIATWQAWIEDAVALADSGDELPAFPQHGEDYGP